MATVTHVVPRARRSPRLGLELAGEDAATSANNVKDRIGGVYGTAARDRLRLSGGGGGESRGDVHLGRGVRANVGQRLARRMVIRNSETRSRR